MNERHTLVTSNRTVLDDLRLNFIQVNFRLPSENVFLLSITANNKNVVCVTDMLFKSFVV